MYAIEPRVPDYHYRIERLVGQTWELVDEERITVRGPLSADQVTAMLERARAEHGGAGRWRLVEEVVHSAVRAEVAE